ncbi:MAG TPA: hypothetical protein VII58_03575 [Acidobacteriaceae bacterium]
MPNQPNPPNDPLDRALAALRTAGLPEGMEARILHTLDARLAEPQPASFLRSAWLRGALTGGLVATAACALVFITLRTERTTAPQTHEAATIQPQQSPTATTVALRTSDPCPGAPSIRDGHGADGWDEKSIQVRHSSSVLGAPSIRDRRSAHEWESITSRAPRLIPASFAPSHPAPPLPLTAQERALMRLVRTASPTQFASLHRPTDDKSDAESQAAFDKFFGPSPEIRAIDEAQRKALGIPDNESTTPSSSKEGQL